MPLSAATSRPVVLESVARKERSAVASTPQAGGRVRVRDLSHVFRLLPGVPGVRTNHLPWSFLVNEQYQSQMQAEPTAAPVYPPQPQMMYVEKKHNGLATASMVLGIIAIIFAFVPIVGAVAVPLAVVAAGLGIPALIKARKTQVGFVKAIAGLVLAVASLLGFAVVTGATVAAIDTAVNEAVTSADEVKVTFGRATTNVLDMTEVKVTVENVSETTQDPMITIAAQSADGSEQYDTALVVVGDLESGQTAHETASFSEELPSDAVFVVTQVI